MKKKFEDLKATDVIHALNMISEHCMQKYCKHGQLKCEYCKYDGMCHGLDGDPDGWNTYDFKKMIEAYIEEAE